MIIVRYRGGLGNQMFQYAFSYALSKRFPNEEILADVTHYELHNEHNGFELEKCFNINIPKAPKAILKKYSPYYVPGTGYSLLVKPIRHLISNNLQFKYYENRKEEIASYVKYYKQKYHNTYDETIFEQISRYLVQNSTENEEKSGITENSENAKQQGDEKIVYLDGLWQNIRYFDEYREELRDIFGISHDISEENSVGIHVRCGDFLHSKFDICGKEYYRKSIDELSKLLPSNSIDKEDRKGLDLQYYVYTDDIVKAMETLQDNTKIYKYINSGIQSSLNDMIAMSQCENLIISNSTFAFWAAYLGNPKTVICPKYSVIKPDESFELYAPNNWIVINNKSI